MRERQRERERKIERKVERERESTNKVVFYKSDFNASTKRLEEERQIRLATKKT